MVSDSHTILEWLTIAGAAIAATTGSVNLYLQWSSKRVDRYRVFMDSIHPGERQETMLHVVSYSAHPITLVDWGLITTDGQFQSFFLFDPWDEIDVFGSESSVLASFGSVYEAGCYFGPAVAGAYASSFSQRRPRLVFRAATPYWLRIKVRLRLLARPNYFLWHSK